MSILSARLSRALRPSVLVLGTLAVLAGCSHDSAKSTADTPISKAVMADLKARLQRKPVAAAPAPDLNTAFAEVLARNSGPLMITTRDGTKAPAVLGMIGENGALRTYATPDLQSFSFRNGVVVATRGLGDDVTASDVDAVVAALRARQSTEVPRTIRFLDGLGNERPLPLSCTIAPAQRNQSYDFAGRRWSGTLMGEHCTGQGFDLTNSYMVAADGSVISSHQWISPKIGYMTFQVLRP